MKRALLIFIILLNQLAPLPASAGLWINQQPIIASSGTVHDSTRKVAAHERPRREKTLAKVVANPNHKRSKGLSIASLICGIFGFWFFPAIAAIILGVMGLKQNPKFKWMAIAGLSLGIAFVLFWAAFLIYFIAFF